MSAAPGRSQASSHRSAKHEGTPVNMRWQRVLTGQAQGLLHCLERAGSLDGLDPYLIWTDLTWPRDSTLAEQAIFPVSFECRLDETGRPVLPGPSLIDLNPVTRDLALSLNSGLFTGFVNAHQILEFACQVQRFRVGLLPRQAVPRARRPPSEPAVTAPPERDGLVIGFIDHGIAFAHQQFAHLHAGRWTSRIERVWDQQHGVPSDPTRRDLGAGLWRVVTGFRYGRELLNLAPSASDAGARRNIDELINSGQDEAAIYRLAAYRPAQAAIAHGIHVMSRAAGRTRYDDVRPAQQLSDGASRASIIAVQLPNRPEKDTSGQSLHVHLLDAVSYILHHAAGRKVVINVSDGAYAGPHDGNSMLERGLSKLFPERAGDRLLVVAAGNQFDERVHWAETLRPGEQRRIDWRLLPDDKTGSHLEIWLPIGLEPEILHRLEIRAKPPGGTTSMPIRLGQTAALTGKGTEASVHACMSFARSPPSGHGQRCMIHVAVAPTPSSRDLPARCEAWHGVWQLSLHNRSPVAVELQAFIERDNPALGVPGPRRQSHFIHPAYPRPGSKARPALGDEDNPSPIRRCGALNTLASAGNLVVVGAHVANTRRLALYSASGPGRAGEIEGVDLLAPSDASELVHGLRASAVRSGSTFRMDGTSVAAPAVTRAAANLMDQRPHVDDLQGALRRVAVTDVAGPPARVGAGRLPD